MKKLTKKQRHEIYKKAYKLLINDKPVFYHEEFSKIELGICTIIGWGLGKKEWEGMDDEQYPEVYLFCPFDGRTFWFKKNQDGYESRQHVLLFCIEMTKP